MNNSENISSIIENGDKLEFHYSFGNNDDNHTLNAYIRNACEKEFLGIIKTLSAELGIHVDVEAEAKKEGSIREIYNFLLSENGIAITAWVGIFLSIFMYIFPRKTKDEKILAQLDIINKAKELESEGIPLPQKMEIYLEKLYSSHKIKKQKSNFFKNLMKEKKIKTLEVSAIDKDAKKCKVLVAIPRSDFESYFLLTDDLESEFDDKAVIEIISPVLKNGRYSWRGIYRRENQIHEFAMTDKEFKRSVVDDGISFQNGTELNCQIEICKKLDDMGEVYNSQYKIHKVFDHRIGDIVTEMPSGKKKREKEKLDNMQGKLFSDTDT